jgi:putative salt-induced outer membrane protein YdiY
MLQVPAHVEPEAYLAARTVDAASIRSINPEPWQLGTGDKFSGEVNLSFEAERGNPDEDELDVDGAIELRRKRDRFGIRGEWERDEADSKKTSDNWMSFAKYDYFVGKNSTFLPTGSWRATNSRI